MKEYDDYCSAVKTDMMGDFGEFNGCMAFDLSESLIGDPEFMSIFRKARPDNKDSSRQIIREVIADDLCR